MKNLVKVVFACFLILFSDQLFAQTKTPISKPLLESINKDGIQVAIQKYQQLKADTLNIIISGNDLLNLGSKLLKENKNEEALKVYDLCTVEFPKSYWGFYQSARAYMTCGQFDKAIENFKRSNELKDWFVTQRFVYVLENYTKTVVDVPMRDGVKLKTIIYSPKRITEKFPFLVVRSPYGIGPYENNVFRSIPGPIWSFVIEGYIFVFQDVRGKFMSEGEFVDVRPFNPAKKTNQDIDESTDAYDTFEWLINQIPNNNGKIGMCGSSYHAFYSLMALLSKHPALTAITSEAPITDWFEGDDFHRNGAFHLLQAVNFFRTNGVNQLNPTPEPSKSILDYPTSDLYSFFKSVGPLKNWNEKFFKNKLPFWNEMMIHASYDQFWKERNIRPYLKNIKTAVLNVGGWYDAENLFGTLNAYKSIEMNSLDNKNIIVMGPWFHGDWIVWGSERYSEILVNKNIAAKFYEDSVAFPFFKYYLKGIGKPNYYETLTYDVGRLKWHKFQSWPPRNIREKVLYFCDNNELSGDRNKLKKNSFNEFQSDPKKPVPHSYKIENGWDSHFMLTDQRFAARRPDVLFYQTEILNESLTIVGDIEVDLYVSTTGTDADWFVKIIDVYPEDEREYEGISDKTHMGEYQSLVRLGVMRGKFRNSLENPEPFIPGKITRVKFKLNDICHTFKKGHKLMVQVQSTCFPLYDINPQQFIDIYKANEKDFIKANHKIYLSNEYSSSISVKVIDSE